MDVLTTPDGRLIEYVELGDPGGHPVVHLHGTPSTAGSAVLLDDAAERHGIRLLGVSGAVRSRWPRPPRVPSRFSRCWSRPAPARPTCSHRS